MSKFGFCATVAVALAMSGSSLTAQQNWVNRLFNCDGTWAGYVFGGSTQQGGYALDSMRSEEMIDWGIDSANSDTLMNISGFRFVLQDQDPTTTHQFSLVAFGEDPAIPDSPDVNTGPLLTAGPFTSPTAAAGQPAAWIFTVTGLTGQFPREQDVFIGVELPAITTTGDILLMQFIDADTTHPAAVYSQPGQSYTTGVPNGSHLCGVDTATNLVNFHGFAGSQIIDVEIFGPGGHALTNSNEANNPATMNGPVTTPSTAFYPDVVDFNSTGRADSIGFIYQDDLFATDGAFVGLVLGTSINPLNAAAAGGPFPIRNVFAGQGNLCTDIITGSPTEVLFFAPTTVGGNGEQYFEQTINVPTSIVTAGLQAVWQGVTATVNNRVRSSGCVLQTL